MNLRQRHYQHVESVDNASREFSLCSYMYGYLYRYIRIARNACARVNCQEELSTFKFVFYIKAKTQSDYAYIASHTLTHLSPDGKPAPAKTSAYDC